MWDGHGKINSVDTARKLNVLNFTSCVYGEDVLWDVQG